jgi:hypothetical protein
MTRAELLAELAAKPYVNAVGTPVKVQGPDEFGDVRYRVGIRKRAKKLVNYEHVHFVQLHEGTGTDVACYLKADLVQFENAIELYDEAAAVAKNTTPVPEV